jgi:hypothetical protein
MVKRYTNYQERQWMKSELVNECCDDFELKMRLRAGQSGQN